jgi:hypothetical protein
MRSAAAQAAEAERFFALGDERRLRAHFEVAGFDEVEIATETLAFRFPSFDAYFGGVERGEGHMGQEYTALPGDVRPVAREEARREVGDAGGPIEVEVEVRIASGRR